MEAAKISLKLLVDKKANKVIFAEARKDFVDFLFHLLSLPIGSVIGLLSNQKMVGCIGNLYKSIEDLNVEYLQQPDQSKDLLLKPKSPTTAFTVVPLLLPSDNAFLSTGKLYRCSATASHNYVSDKKFTACPSCLSFLSHEVKYISSSTNAKAPDLTSGGGYVKGLVTYMVMDDLSVTPISMICGIAVLNKFNIREFDSLEERVVSFGIDEGLRLLRSSMHSKEARLMCSS